MPHFTYRHVDVFAAAPLSGNGLTVFELQHDVPTTLLQAITQEMRQFESIFLWRTAGGCRARIFTMDEELAFAGHPLLGAAAVWHERHGADHDAFELRIELAQRAVALHSRRAGAAFEVTLDAGVAEFVATVPEPEARALLAALDLTPDDLAPGLPLQVVSTGLPYLIVPLRRGLERVRVVQRGFEALLQRWGAKFAYPLDVAAREGRSWDNDGRSEDIATGSAAGPAAAYLQRHGLLAAGEEAVLHQGRFVGRPSRIAVCVQADGRVRVGGRVLPVGRGELEFQSEE